MAPPPPRSYRPPLGPVGHQPPPRQSSAIVLFVLIVLTLIVVFVTGYWLLRPIAEPTPSPTTPAVAQRVAPQAVTPMSPSAPSVAAAPTEPPPEAGPLLTPVPTASEPAPAPKALQGPAPQTLYPVPNIPAPMQPPPPAPPAPTHFVRQVVTDDGRFLGGMPQSTDQASRYEVLVNSAYVVGYSETRKDPLWSAYRVIRMETPNHIPRPKGNFISDTRTKAAVTHQDFTGSGFDRGHMTPNSAIARCFGVDAQHETFLLSNICPQAPALNQKVWEKLEQAEIGYADHFETVWVVDGPIFADLNGGTTRTLKAGIAIPLAFYKIVSRLDKTSANDGVAEFSVIMPQTVKGMELPAQYLSSVDKIEVQTHLRFFTAMSPAAREAMSEKVSPMW